MRKRSYNLSLPFIRQSCFFLDFKMAESNRFVRSTSLYRLHCSTTAKIYRNSINEDPFIPWTTADILVQISKIKIEIKSLFIIDYPWKNRGPGSAHCLPGTSSKDSLKHPTFFDCCQDQPRPEKPGSWSWWRGMCFDSFRWKLFWTWKRNGHFYIYYQIYNRNNARGTLKHYILLPWDKQLWM
jgi:hypothetical protein